MYLPKVLKCLIEDFAGDKCSVCKTIDISERCEKCNVALCMTCMCSQMRYIQNDAYCSECSEMYIEICELCLKNFIQTGYGCCACNIFMCDDCGKWTPTGPECLPCYNSNKDFEDYF